MTEKINLAKSVAAFSKKFTKLNDEDKAQKEAPVTKDKILQDQINLRESEREEELRRRFSDFTEPRTQDIEEDEENLIKAYEFYCKLTEFCENEKSDNKNTKLRSMELSSPLCKKADYTLGDEIAFLRLWFLQKVPETDVLPEFTRAENGVFYLTFTEREIWAPTPLEKEILRALKNSED